MPFFVPDDYMYATFEKRYDADGKVWMNAQAGGDIVAKTPYGVIADEYGPILAALPAANKHIYVGVPEAAAAIGDNIWVQIGGYVADMITASLSVSVGHGLTVNTGAIADIGADFSGAAGEFCVNIVDTTTLTVHTVILFPDRIITV